MKMCAAFILAKVFHFNIQSIMGLGPRLDLRQSQQLVMTPQLQQAIKLLALSNIELEAVIAVEVEKNPLLELGEPDLATPETPAETGDVQQTPAEFDADGISEMSADDAMRAGTAENTSALDMDVDDSVFHHNGASDTLAESASGAGSLDGSLGLNGSTNISGGDGDDEGYSFDQRLTEEISLHDHLTTQAGLKFSTMMDRAISSHLIDMIDDSGYLVGDLADVAARLDIPVADVESVLKLIQTFDPVGVGARSLSECLALQAKESDRYDPAMATMIANLDVLARGDMPALKRLCRVDHEDLADMIRELRAYNPKPGLVFGGERVQTVVPDIYVRKNAAGAWAVELNSATLPRVLVNRSYYAELSAKGAGKTQSREDKLFLSDCLANASWLVKALDQRARTILKVTSELVRQQEEFFEQGVRYLKPLTLRTIAEAIGMHESTVSRVTSNKYLSCSRGMFELKYFFTSAIQASDGGATSSAESVKSRIKELIDAERVDAILSDDQIVDILQRDNLDIARRTVAKYREAMRIPSSVQRRRLKSVGGHFQAARSSGEKAVASTY
jgi:RNA polymerase sigma-54 factor